MRNKRGIVSILAMLVLLISSISLFMSCDNPNGGSSSNSNNITITFEEGKISCENAKDNSPIKNGAIVLEGTELWFNAKNIPSGKVVEKWIIGKSERVGKDYAFYQVSKNDADISNKIKVNYTVKTPNKLKIVFDETKVECKKDSTTIANNSEVFEQDRLEFRPKTIASDKSAVWEINGKEPWSNFNYLSYRVRLEDKNSSNEIKLIYSERDKEKITIQFDTTKIKCTNESINKTVTSGSKILEGIILKFETVSGNNVEWEIGNVSYMGAKKEQYVTVYKGRSFNGIIQVNYKGNTPSIIDDKYIGNYEGTFTGTFTGTWTGNVNEYGIFSGTFNDGSENCPAEGTVDNSGNFIGKMTKTSVNIDINFTGTITDTGEVNGSWKNSTISATGSFTGNKQ